MVLDKANLGYDRRQIGRIIKNVSGGWNSLLAQKKEELRIAADIINYERQKHIAIDPRDTYKKYSKYLDEVINLLKSEYDLDVICFVCPGNALGFRPEAMCHAAGKSIDLSTAN